jgi:hypothetical protein
MSTHARIIQPSLLSIGPYRLGNADTCITQSSLFDKKSS